MAKVEEFKQHLKEGQVYRRADLAQWSNAVDRHIAVLMKEGYLHKLSSGLYHVPKKSVFGTLPPDEEALVKTFLNDDEFLVTSPNAYNSLGVGTTQLYNRRVVYNHKRHGEFNLGGKRFFFHARHRFPNKLSEEFLLIDLVNNIEKLAEDKETVLMNVLKKVRNMDVKKLASSVSKYGNRKTKALLKPVLTNPITSAHVY